MAFEDVKVESRARVQSGIRVTTQGNMILYRDVSAGLGLSMDSKVTLKIDRENQLLGIVVDGGENGRPLKEMTNGRFSLTARSIMNDTGLAGPLSPKLDEYNHPVTGDVLPMYIVSFADAGSDVATTEEEAPKAARRKTKAA